MATQPSSQAPLRATRSLLILVAVSLVSGNAAGETLPHGYPLTATPFAIADQMAQLKVGVPTPLSEDERKLLVALEVGEGR